MIGVRTVALVGSRIVLIGLFAIVFAGCETVREYCSDEHGCMGHPANGEAAVNGGTCTSGIACNNPGASCVIGGAKKCRNYNMGGGNCTCACMS